MYIKIVNGRKFFVKKCISCGEEKQVGAFGRSKTTDDKYNDICKYCIAVMKNKNV
jgi:hypothetical protein